MQILTSDRTFETRSANPYLPYGSTAPPLAGTGGMSAAGTTINADSALTLAAVWGSVDLIASSIATLPIRQWRLVGDEAKPMESAAVIAQPWPEITQRDFITQGTVSQLLAGNIFGKITSRDERLYPSQVQLQVPDRVFYRRNRETGALEWRFGNQPVATDDVTRAMGMSSPGGVIGLNPIEHLRVVLGVARAQDLWNAAYYMNSAEPRGVIQVEGDLDTNETLAMAKSWMQAHQGIGNAHLPAVLTGGATFLPISMSFTDQQFIESLSFSASQISGFIYRIPPHMLGMVDKTTSWGTGVEQQELGFVRNTLLIWLARWEDLLSSWLPPRQFVTFDLSERLKGDTLSRMQAHQIERVIGVRNALEIRKAEGWPAPTDPAEIELLSRYDQPLNSSPMKPLQGDGGDKSGKPTEK